MGITTMKESFVHDLKDIYDAEHQFLEGQEQMLKKAAEPALAKGLQKHIGETQKQIQNLEQVFKLLGQRPERQTCDGAKGLVSEAQKVMQETAVAEIRDALIAGAASKAESYEVQAYTGMVASAQLMGQDKVATLLERNLKQEEKMLGQLEKSEPKLLKRALTRTGEAKPAARR